MKFCRTLLPSPEVRVCLHTKVNQLTYNILQDNLLRLKKHKGNLTQRKHTWSTLII